MVKFKIETKHEGGLREQVAFLLSKTLAKEATVTANLS